jgi:hypothetical protein
MLITWAYANKKSNKMPNIACEYSIRQKLKAQTGVCVTQLKTILNRRVKGNIIAPPRAIEQNNDRCASRRKYR